MHTFTHTNALTKFFVAGFEMQFNVATIRSHQADALLVGTVVTALLVIVAKNIKPGVSDEALEEAVA